MSRILLIDVRGWQGGVNAGNPFPNVGIAYLVSSLKLAGHHVVVADMNNLVMDDIDIIQAVRTQNIDIVGISIKTSTVGNARRLGLQLKKHLPSVPILLGGAHATLLAATMISEPWVDYVFVGEAEDTLPAFCNDPSLRHYGRLPGLMTKDGNQAAPHLVEDLDLLPFPDYEAFPWIYDSRFVYPLLTSRGCAFNCTYCSVPKISGNKFRKREPEKIITELEESKKRFSLEEFSIIDDSFNLDIARAKEFCSLLLERNMGLRWSCPNGIRADQIDVELARLMKLSGCESVMIGIESSDVEILAAVNKGETLEEIKHGISLLKESGLSVGGYFVIGLPGDSYNAEERTVAFALEHEISAHFNMLVPYPGTELSSWVKRYGRTLLPVEDGVHFSDSSGAVQPVFDTTDFIASERIRAYEMVHTRLARFDMLIPSRTGKIRYYLEALRLYLKYDRAQLLRRIRRRLIGR